MESPSSTLQGVGRGLDLLIGQPWVPDLTIFIAGDRNVVYSPKFETGSRKYLELH